MKKREKEVLFQLLRNSKLSDREMAKKLNTSQSTITRTRHKLEKKCINSYTIVPNLSKLGINLIAFTLGGAQKYTPELSKKVRDFIIEQPNIVFGGLGEGLGKTGITISFHKDFSDYTELMRKARAIFANSNTGVHFESFIVPTDNLIRTLNMTNAVEHLINKNENHIVER